MIARLIAAAATVTLAAGCAQTYDEPQSATAYAEGERCFWPSQVTGFRKAPDRDGYSDRILVDVGVNDTYLFETLGSCSDLDYAETIGFDQHGSGTICQGIDVTLVVPSPIGERRCAVRMIRKLSEVEEAAL